MTEKRFWFVIDKGKLECVQDNSNDRKITITELEDLLNEQEERIKELEKENKELKEDNERLKQRIRDLNNGVGFDD